MRCCIKRRGLVVACGWWQKGWGGAERASGPGGQELLLTGESGTKMVRVISSPLQDRLVQSRSHCNAGRGRGKRSGTRQVSTGKSRPARSRNKRRHAQSL